MDRRIYDQYFLKTMEAGSITAAARSLHVSQPALSNGLTALEKELGFRILDRKTTPVSFTEEGKLYHEYLLRMQTLKADFERRLDASRAARENSVTIGAPVVYVDTVVTDAVQALLEKEEDCHVVIKTASLEDLVQMAEEGEINCFVSTTDELPSHFSTRLIRKERICMGVPESVLRLKDDLQPRDFHEKPFILLEEQQPLRLVANSFFRQHGIRPVHRLTTDQVSTAVLLAERGHGICFASEDTLNNTRLQIYPLPVHERAVFIAYDRELYMPEAAARLIGFLEENEI